MNNHINNTIKRLAIASQKADGNLNSFMSKDFIEYFITDFANIFFEDVHIDSKFLTFDIAAENMPTFWAEKSNVEILGYNAEVVVYCSNQREFSVQIEFNDDRLPEMVDIEGNFVLYPPDLLQFLASNKQVNEKYLLNDWRVFGIQRAQTHIAQIEKLIEYYRTKL